MKGVVIEEYRPQDDPAALELERACPQGRGLVLGFRRPTFRRRSESFSTYRIWVARVDGRLVGTQAAAIKPVVIRGRPTDGAFIFDLRVHPDLRQLRGIGRALARQAMDWSLARAELLYVYTMADNRAVHRIGAALGAADAGGYAYFVLPVALLGQRRNDAKRSEAVAVRERHRAVNPPFDLDTDPSAEPPRDGYRGSWISAGAEAGCSAWDNTGVLAEVVEALPPGLALLSRVRKALRWASWLPLPPLPSPGEPLRSWYLFDFFAAHPAAALDVLRAVGRDARTAGIDYLYVIHTVGDPVIALLRRRFPKPLTPVLPYRLIARDRSGPCGEFASLHVDIRDV